MKDPKEITRTNQSEYYNQIPEGYILAYKGKKKMTEEARGRLRGYWINVVNQKEIQEEIKRDREKGLCVKFSQEWLLRYSSSQFLNIAWLVSKKFIKREKNERIHP